MCLVCVSFSASGLCGLSSSEQTEQKREESSEEPAEEAEEEREMAAQSARAGAGVRAEFTLITWAYAGIYLTTNGN